MSMRPSEEIRPRRKFLCTLVLAGAYVAAIAAGTLRAGRVVAAPWNQAAFDARAVAAVLDNIGAVSISDSGLIQLKAPEIAENGAIVPIEITSLIPDTQTIYIIADRNPQPLVAFFDISPHLEPFISTRIKMRESSTVRVLVRAGGKFYGAAQEVKVTIGGCGA